MERLTQSPRSLSGTLKNGFSGGLLPRHDETVIQTSMDCAAKFDDLKL